MGMRRVSLSARRDAYNNHKKRTCWWWTAAPILGLQHLIIIIFPDLPLVSMEKAFPVQPKSTYFQHESNCLPSFAQANCNSQNRTYKVLPCVLSLRGRRSLSAAKISALLPDSLIAFAGAEERDGCGGFAGATGIRDCVSG